jgi:hypothetical protein
MPLTLTLTLEHRDGPQRAGLDDEALPGTCTLTCPAVEDASIHRWFRLFERVLLLAGFAETTIASGACGLAFHDGRPPQLMHQIAAEYDLADFLARPVDCQGPPSSSAGS